VVGTGSVWAACNLIPGTVRTFNGGLGTPTDDVTLAGPAAIAVSNPVDALPCALATSPCTSQSSLDA
jgi:hypothetical protein